MADFNVLHLLWAIRDIPSSVLNVQEKIILYTLLSCVNKDNICWHSQITLSKMCSLSETSVKKYTKTLSQKGFIKISMPAQYNRANSNQYSLIISNFSFQKLSTMGSPHDPLNDKKGSPRDGKGSPRDPRRGRRATIKKEREEIKEEGALRPRFSERGAALPEDGSNIALQATAEEKAKSDETRVRHMSEIMKKLKVRT
jgi:hypothetical protein